MRASRDPIIVTASTGPYASGAPADTVADVLIGDSDGRAAGEQCADLFARCPGAGAVLISDAAGALAACFRNGLVVMVQVADPAQLSGAAVVELAELLYVWWCHYPLAKGEGAR